MRETAGRRTVVRLAGSMVMPTDGRRPFEVRPRLPLASPSIARHTAWGGSSRPHVRCVVDRVQFVSSPPVTGEGVGRAGQRCMRSAHRHGDCPGSFVEFRTLAAGFRWRLFGTWLHHRSSDACALPVRVWHLPKRGVLGVAVRHPFDYSSRRPSRSTLHSSAGELLGRCSPARLWMRT